MTSVARWLATTSCHAEWVKFSDEHLYLVSKPVTFDARAKDYPDDFNGAGDVKRSASLDPVPLLEVCGLFFYAVYKDYYILGGRQLATIFR